MSDSNTTAAPTALPMSLRAYAKRRGVSAMAVSVAVKKGRLRESVVRDGNGDPKIADPELADREWAQNTDHGRAPTYVKERGLGPVAPTVSPEALERSAKHAAIHPDPDHFDGAPPPSAVGSPEAMTLGAASTLEKVWRAKLAELKYREQAGELIPAKDVTSKLTSTFLQCRTRLLGLPSRAKQALPHLSLADVGVLEGIVREALEELASEGAKS